ncbi:MAG: AMP-binding protein, partial [Stellaceae bacterium]
MTAEIGRDASLTLPKTIEAAAVRFGPAPALLSDRASLTYGALGERSNRYARWALAQGLGKGDVVALLMSNCPEYAAVWLGLTRIGVVVALVNAHLAGEALAHSIRVATPRLALVDGEHAGTLARVLPLVASGIECRSIGDGAEGKFLRLEDAIAGLSGDPLDERTFRPPMLRDRALCIYTSGTTGL